MWIFTSKCGLIWHEPSLVCLILTSMVLHTAHAEDYFYPGSIENRGGLVDNIDLSSFDMPGGQIAGRYRTQIYLNGNYVAEKILKYENGVNGLVPDIRREDLVKWGVSQGATSEFEHSGRDNLSKHIDVYLPDSTISYDFTQRRLDVSIPQAYMTKSAQGAVSPEEWDDGLPAVFLNYAYAGSSSNSDYLDTSEQNNYLNLRSGVNLGAWRIRNYSSWSNSTNSRHWNNISTYIQKDVKSLKAQFLAGDSYTPSEVFDSFSFRGMQLMSDDNMLPESLRGFAPVIRGIAQSNARVTVRQNGNIIYQSYVSPGAFSINDLYPTSSSGDLIVSIRESDGTVREFKQAFSAVPVMQREGRIKYSVTAGKYRIAAEDHYLQSEPSFIQSTGIYGMPYATTLYGGILFSRDYTGGSIGLGMGMGNIGSVSVDSTWARSKLEDVERQGSTLRFQYSKDFTDSGTTFTLAGYRYSTSGYLDFNEANGNHGVQPQLSHAEILDSEEATAHRAYAYWRAQHNKRSRAQLNVNQTLGDFGSLYVSAYQQQFWGVGGRENNLNFGYSVSVSAINYMFNYAWSESPYYRQKDRVMSLNVQIPFDRFIPTSWLNLSTSQTSPGANVTSKGISGTTLADNNLSYNIQQGHTSRGGDNTGSATVDYKASFGEYQAGYNYTRQTEQINYAAMGGVVVHPHGLTLSQPLGDTFALVRADKAAGVKVENNTGLYTDGRGYAIIPYVTPYRRNAVKLNTVNLERNVDVTTDTKIVVPGQGALVMADFPTTHGYKAMLTLISQKSIPFGASAKVVNGNQNSLGIIDDQQQVYLSGVPQHGIVNVNWQGGQCMGNYDLSSNKPTIHLITVQCQ